LAFVKYTLLPNLGCILGLVKVKLYEVGPTIYKNILTFIIPNVYNIKNIFHDDSNSIEIML
jgi:hypothetical protein